MKATVTPINQRITLQLNVAIVFEALILHRLRSLPKTRCDDWLRGLLVQGFQRECRALRKVQRAGRSRSTRASTQNVALDPSVVAERRQSTVPQAKINSETELAATKARHTTSTVSFSMLRKVIG